MTAGERIPAPRRNSGYTLLEVLLALGVVAILLGIAIPALMQSFAKSESEELSDSLVATVKATRASSLDSGEARRIAIYERGLAPDGENLPSAWLPKNWKLEVRRMTESKFRRPNKQEFWGFNSAGICEPITLRLTGPRDSTELAFDPLTGAVLDDQ